MAEQRQIFKGADHAFLWKPKPRIPDIHESVENQRAFGRLLHACDCCDTAEAIVEAIRRIDELKIKGLGPAVANPLYFIHPTLVMPFNTAIVRGYNAVTGGSARLGRWDHYLSMRQGALRLMGDHRPRLSNDMGAIARLFFDIGTGHYQAPPRAEDAQAMVAWAADLERLRGESDAARRQSKLERQSDVTHTQIQGCLRDPGRAMGFDVWIASNDRGRLLGEGRLGDGCLCALPEALQGGADAIGLIDVVWSDAASSKAVAAFEVEHSTSIYSGIVRMLDLALGTRVGSDSTLLLVAPDGRRSDVQQQLRRPAFSSVSRLGIRYLAYSQLQQHLDAMSSRRNRNGSLIFPSVSIAHHCFTSTSDVLFQGA